MEHRPLYGGFICMEPETAKVHELNFRNREQGTMTGISDVFSFDEHEILLATTQGMLTLRGKELHVSRLCLEEGEVDVEGRIDSLVYSELGKKRSGDRKLLARLFG